MLDRLRSLWNRNRVPPTTITVYTRSGCSCCDKALVTLQAARRRHPLHIETIDVDANPELAARYGLEVPVVAVDGVVRFRGVVNPVLLERLLARSQRNRTAFPPIDPASRPTGATVEPPP
ncbi:MAG: hypothetical protein KatS3mg108_2141 [Isosphaeraceae bacterium]|nr:MAG: hypothetical protein KatS3mg108_2141 [Isosphaeraceae bacterium]